MNFREITWVQVRNILLAFSGVAVGLGLGTDVQIRELIDAVGTVVGALGAAVYIGTTVWQWFVRFKTMSVPVATGERKDVPTISPASGAVEPADKHKKD